MTCPRCLEPVPADAPFCAACGQLLLRAAACPRCQATTPPDAQFCPQCGLPFVADEQPDLPAGMGVAAPPTLPRTSAPELLDAGDTPSSAHSQYSTFPAVPRGAFDPPTVPATTTGAGSEGFPRATARLRSWAARAAGSVAHDERARAGMPLVAAALLLALVYAVRVLLLRGDWAAGVLALGIAAVVLAAGALAVVVVGALQPGPLRANANAALLLLALSSLSATGGLVFAPRLHTLQARGDERAGQWAAAIGEYRQAEGASASSDILRVYAEWVGSNSAAVPYQEAIAYFQSTRASAQCDTLCQRTAMEDEALARYQYGQRLAQTGHYAAALTQLQAVEGGFAASPYAHLAHLAAARTLLALGQQQFAGQQCGPAAATYTTLAARYADTPQGAQAATALAKGVAVSGMLVNLAGLANVTLYLSRQALPCSSTTYHYCFSRDYTTHADASGQFSFANVRPGNYNLSARGSFGITYWYLTTPPYSPYTIVVGALCPIAAGTFSPPPS